MTPEERRGVIARREFIAGTAAAALTILKSAPVRAGQDAVSGEKGAGAQTPHAAGREIIYTGVSLEFVQLWDHHKRIQQARELGLGNLVLLASTFHLGNEDERRRWKERYPALAGQIDKVPRTQTLPQVGAAAILALPDDILVEEARLCRENGLYFGTASCLSACEGEACTGLFARLREAGGTYWLSHSMLGEHTSSLSGGRTAAVWKSKEGIDPAGMNPQSMRDWYVNRDHKAVEAARKAGAPAVDNIEATAQFRLGLAAGMDYPILELVPYEPVSGLAAVRGAARAYGRPMWGVCFAFGYYRPPVDPSTPNRARIAYNLAYAAGARIFCDLNDYFHVYSLGAGWFEDPRPPARLGEPEFRDFDDPICAAQRKLLQDHYRFVQFHDRPPGGPRVTLGFVLGHLDGFTGFSTQSQVWGVNEPGWEAGDAEKTWQYFHRLYDVEPWYTPTLRGYWQSDPVQTVRYGTPPCGQVDIVPVEAPLPVLQTYGCLVFLGWNTMDEATYDKLRDYVRAGGRLLMSVPQLSSQVERQREPKLLRGGDFGDLFGVRITGPGDTTEAVKFVAAGQCPSYQFPEGAAYQEAVRLAKAELTTARALATDSRGAPLLVENRVGTGFAWLLTTWEYPGLHLQHFMTDLLHTISNGQQDRITVEGDAIYFAVYGQHSNGDDLTTIYLVNRNMYGLPEYARVAVQGKPTLLRVDGYDLRIIWTQKSLLVSPFDRFVKVVGLSRSGSVYDVSLVAQRGIHRIQLACLDGQIDRVSLEGVPQQLQHDAENCVSFESGMDGPQEVTVYLRKG